MYKCFLICLSALALTACAAVQDRAGKVCGAPEGWQEVAAVAEGHLLVFGETHGTEEMPDLFESYVCAASRQGGRTLVGLEYSPSTFDAAMAALASDNPEGALNEAMPRVWAQLDGRGSEAMRDLVLSLGKMEDVGIVFFDAIDLARDFDAPLGGTPEEITAWFEALDRTELHAVRDRRMAEALMAAFTDDYDRAVVLVGNQHAAKARWPFFPEVDNAAQLLPEGTITLVDRHDEGMAFVERTISPRAASLEGVPEGAIAPLMALVPGGLAEGRYDGFFYVGPITASPPALPKN